MLRFCLALGLLCGAALAQSSAGGATIQGTVKDASGAAIAGAKLTITHLDTGVQISTVTNGDGFYTTPPVQIGKHKVHCEAPGMKAWEQEVTLETGATAEVDPAMTVGAINQTIVVSEEAALVTTTDPTDATTLDSRRIKELPINGRDLNTLLSDVTPGLEQVIDVNGGVRGGWPR